MHSLPIIFTLLSANTITCIVQQPRNLQPEKPRSSKQPKSIFIVPLLEPCSRGHVQDEEGKCLRVITVKEPSTIPRFLNRLQNFFADHQKKIDRLKEQNLRHEKPKESEKGQARIQTDLNPTEKTQEPRTGQTQIQTDLNPTEKTQQPRTEKENAAKENLLKHEEGQQPQDQKECRREEEPGGYSVQSAGSEAVPSYHQYYVQNVTTEEIFDFVSYQAKTNEQR